VEDIIQLTPPRTTPPRRQINTTTVKKRPLSIVRKTVRKNNTMHDSIDLTLFKTLKRTDVRIVYAVKAPWDGDGFAKHELQVHKE